MKICLISGSLSENSRSRQMVKYVQSVIEKEGVETSYIDLRDVKMDFCDGRKESYGEDIENAKKIMDEADSILFGYGVYCYSIPASLKNFVDIAFPSMSKLFGQIIAAGGANSFLAHEHFSQILKNETHAPPYPGVIYADYPTYPGGEFTNEKFNARIDKYVKGFIEMTGKLADQ